MKKFYLFNCILYVSLTMIVFNSYSQTAKDVVKSMGPGFNLGNVFDNGLKPTTFTSFKPVIDAYVAAGMTNIRIPTTWYDYVNGTRLTDVNGNINTSSPRFIELVTTVDYALSKGLYVVLNTHHEHWLKDNYDGSAYYNNIFSNLWTNIANHFKNYPSKLVFEVLNEPEGIMGQWGTPVLPTAESGILLTRQINKVGYDAIRATGGNNTTRIVMISPNGQANDSQIEEVYPNVTILPGSGNDQYLAMHVHSYDPWNFCGQTGSNANYPGTARIISDITVCNTHAQNNLGGIAVHYGEFGVGRITNQAERSAAVVTEYYQTFAKTCINLGMAFSVWDDRGWFSLINDAGTAFTYNLVPNMLSGLNKAPTVSITAPLTGTVFASGTTINLTATAADTAPGTVSSVSFYDGATLLNTDTSSPYSFTWAGATIGTHSITAVATDNNGAVSTSTSVSITVNAPNTPPTVSLTAPVTGSNFELGNVIVLTATATDTTPGTVTSVSFYDGATLLGTDLTSPYSFSWTGATAGVHSITARATDNNGAVSTSNAASITVVNTAPTVSITAPVTGSSYTSGTSISLAATAADTAPGTVSSVSFYDGATLLGTDTSSPFSFTWTGASVGTHSITARATDNNGATTTSGAVSITVNAVASNPLTLSYFHFVNKWTTDYMRPTAGGLTATITQYEEAAVPTLDSYQWEFRAVTGTNYYYIINKFTQKAIQPTGGVNTDNTGLSQTTLTATNQGLTELHWSVTASNEAGFYWIQNRKSLLYIRPNAGTNGTGVEIVQNALNTTLSSFKWNLVKLGDKPVTNARIATTISEMNQTTDFTKENLSVEASETIDEIVATTIYPNPADAVIKLRTFVKEEGTVNVTIYDIVGKMLITKKYQSRVGWLQENIDISELKIGTYILKINQGSFFETKKLIKF